LIQRPALFLLERLLCFFSSPPYFGNNCLSHLGIFRPRCLSSPDFSFFPRFLFFYSLPFFCPLPPLDFFFPRSLVLLKYSPPVQFLRFLLPSVNFRREPTFSQPFKPLSPLSTPLLLSCVIAVNWFPPAPSFKSPRPDCICYLSPA